MSVGGPTRTSNTGTVCREAEANTIAKGILHGCQPACQDPEPTVTQPDPVVAMAEFLPQQCGMSYHDSAH